MLFTSDIEVVNSAIIDGFFVGWPNPPSAAILRRLCFTHLIESWPSRITGWSVTPQDSRIEFCFRTFRL